MRGVTRNVFVILTAMVASQYAWLGYDRSDAQALYRYVLI